MDPAISIILTIVLLAGFVFALVKKATPIIVLCGNVQFFAHFDSRIASR